MFKQQNNHQQQIDSGGIKDSSATVSPSDMSGGLWELLHLIWWNKRWIALWVGVCAAAAIIFILMSTKTYTATAHLLMETRNPQILRSMSLIPGLTADTQLIESQIELMRSKRIIKMAIQKLTEKSGISNKVVKMDGNKQAVAASGHPAPTELQIKQFAEDLAINRKGLTYLVVVEYTNKDRQQAANAANAMIDSYITHLKSNRRNTTRAAYKWLLDSIKLLRGDLQKAEENVLLFESENKLSRIGGSTLFEREMTDAANQLALARTNAAQSLARLQQVEKLKDNPKRLTGMEEVLLSAVIQRYRTQLSSAQRELAKATDLYGLDNENTRNARADLKNVRQQMQSEIGRIVEKYRNDYEIANNQVKIMKRQILQMEEQVSKRHKQMVILTELRRQAAATSQLYVSLLTRAKETKSQESLEQIDVRIISYAAPPSLPSYPRKGIVLALALMLGLSVGTVTSVIAGHRRPYIRSPEQIKNLLGLVSPIALSKIAGRPVNGKGNLQRQVIENSDSRYSQSIFTLFNIIEENSKSMSGGKVIAIISARDDEGKSTTAINLADQAALAGCKTLLIDGDLRQARLTTGLHHDSQPDLLDAASAGYNLTDFLPREKNEGFWFCAAPPAEKYQRPMNLLASDDIGHLLNMAREEFEVILIDTSSLLDAVDAQGIVQRCDLAILVVGWGVTTPAEIERILERARIKNRAKNLVLAVLNKVRNDI